MTLPTRPLGTSGLQITTVGFGSWALGGTNSTFGWGPQDDTRSLDAITHAVGLGVNWIDTAAVYGRGHSEEVVGRALRALPASSRPLVFTKCGLEWDDAEPEGAERHEATPQTIRRGMEDSLRRLGLDHVDLFQIHWPDDQGNPMEPAWLEMLKLKEEGLTRPSACPTSTSSSSNAVRRSATSTRCSRRSHLIGRETAEELLPWAEQHGTGVLCYSPMKNGILTDSFSPERVARMAEDDWRRSAPNFREPALSRNLALRDALRPVAERHGATVASVAVAWTLAWPGVTAAIVGARAPEQVDGWIGAAALELTAADLDEIAAAIRETGAGAGPSDPRR